MKLGPLLRVSSRQAWRAWLRKHHRTEREVWLVAYASSTGRRGISYNDAVDEALCFGWIDSTVKKVPGEAGARAQRFTPRRPGSALSELNKARVRRLVRERRMTKAGLAAVAHHADVLAPRRLFVAPDLRRALQAAPPAWQNFQAFPEAYRRIRVGWIESARGRPEVFRKRLAYFVTKTQRNQQYGMVRG